MDRHLSHLRDRHMLAEARRAQATEWLEEFIRERFGREGLKKAGPVTLEAAETPFTRLAEVSSALG
jgi:LAO/AO transport system kinase